MRAHLDSDDDGDEIDGLRRQHHWPSDVQGPKFVDKSKTRNF